MNKKLTAVFVALLFAAHLHALGPTPIDAKTAQNIKTYAPAEFDIKKEMIVGQIIKLKFVARDSGISETTTGALESWIYLYDFQRNKDGSSSRRVQFPAEFKEAFLKLNTDTDKRAPVFFIGRVCKDDDGHYVAFLGREIRTDHAGPKIVW